MRCTSMGTALQLQKIALLVGERGIVFIFDVLYRRLLDTDHLNFSNLLCNGSLDAVLWNSHICRDCFMRLAIGQVCHIDEQ
jgi:hypothetical protein